MIPALPSVRPGEIGSRWFAHTIDEEFDGTAFKFGEVALVANLKATEAATTAPATKLSYDESDVKMLFLIQDAATHVDDVLVGATRDEAGRMVIDFQLCE